MLRIMSIVWLSALFLGLSFATSPLRAQGVSEDTRFHGRFNLGLGYGPGRTLSTCLRLQSDRDFDIARDDCGIAEGVFLFSREFYRSVGEQVWARGVIDVHLRTNVQRSWSDTLGSDGENLEFNNRNFYAETGNLLGAGEVLWFGNRSYDYEDIWLLDLRLLDQHGPGFGINNIDLGMGRLGVAFFRVSSRQGGPAQDTLDLRWSQLPILEGFGKVVVIATQTGRTDARTGEEKYAPMQGVQAGFVYLWENEALWHKWAVQYGSGLFGGSDQTTAREGRGIALNDTGEDRDPNYLLKDVFQNEREAWSRSRSFRLADQVSYTPAESAWSLHAAVALEQVDFGGLRYEKDGRLFDRGDMRTVAYALRPAYDLSEVYGLDVSWADVHIEEGLGYKAKDRSGIEQETREPVDRRLQRASLGFLIRPLAWGYAEFRTYVAWNRWNKDIQRDITDGPLRDDTEGVTGGLTLQMWW